MKETVLSKQQIIEETYAILNTNLKFKIADFNI